MGGKKWHFHKKWYSSTFPTCQKSCNLIMPSPCMLMITCVSNYTYKKIQITVNSFRLKQKSKFPFLSLNAVLYCRTMFHLDLTKKKHPSTMLYFCNKVVNNTNPHMTLDRHNMHVLYNILGSTNCIKTRSRDLRVPVNKILHISKGRSDC